MLTSVDLLNLELTVKIQTSSGVLQFEIFHDPRQLSCSLSIRRVEFPSPLLDGRNADLNGAFDLYLRIVDMAFRKAL